MKTRRTMVLIAAGGLLILLSIAGSVVARVPADEPAPSGASEVSVAIAPLLQYQGRLTNPGTGQPVADGTYAMIFKLYDVVSGGAALWTETKNVPVAGGLFSTALGDTTPLAQSLFNGQALWLGITVGGDLEATPRQAVLPVAYALSLVPGAVMSATSGSSLLQAHNTGNAGYFTSTTTYGVRAETASIAPGQAGVLGVAGWSGVTPSQEVGVLGKAAAGMGVAGISDIQTGVYGYSDTFQGVRGDAGGDGTGVLGYNSGNGLGVSGYNAGNGYGGYFRSTSGLGGYFYGGNGTAIIADGSAVVAGNLKTSRVTYSSPRTHYFIVGSEGFVPGSNVAYVNTYGNGGANIVSGSGALVAPVHLPQGAVVTGFKVFFNDTSAGDMTVILDGQYMTSGGYFSMAIVSSSGTAGYYSGTDTTISSPTIDNTIYSYDVYAYSSAWDSNLKIKGALITYTINEAP